MPFRMWLYPVPSVVALAGWLFVWSTSARDVMLSGLAVLALGVVVFFVWRAFVPVRPAEVSV